MDLRKISSIWSELKTFVYSKTKIYPLLCVGEGVFRKYFNKVHTQNEISALTVASSEDNNTEYPFRRLAYLWHLKQTNLQLARKY